MSPKDLGNLKVIRKELGKSQSELARLLSVSVRAVQSYEQGWRPTPSYVLKIAMVQLFIYKRKDHVKLSPCWKIRNCGPELTSTCEAYQNEVGDLCWLVTGTNCNGKVLDTWDDKFALCKECDVMRLWLEN